MGDSSRNDCGVGGRMSDLGQGCGVGGGMVEGWWRDGGARRWMWGE